jgi:Tol biopolymer transport system component
VGKANVVAAAALLLVSGASATPDSEHAGLTVPVVFRTDWVPRYRTAEIYVIPARGGPPRALTRNEVDDVQPAWSPSGSTIVFSRQGDLFTISRRGRIERRLTRTATREVDALWSPDGRRLAFEGGRFGREQIYVMNSNGSSRRRITNDRVCARDPSWADGGTRVVFVACTGPTSLMSIRADGTDQRPIATNPPLDDFDDQPALSPDGKRLVFTRTVSDTGQTELWIANADGAQPRRLIRDAAQAVWSPDGTRLALVHGPHLRGDKEGYYFVGGPKVSVMNGDGSGIRHLTPQPDYFYGGVGPFPGWRWARSGIRILGLSWSPDGRFITYSRRVELRHPDLALLAPGARSAARLTANRVIDAEPALSPNGREVAFLRFSTVGRSSLLVKDLEGGRERRIALRAWGPAWSPDGRWIAYSRHNGIHVIEVSKLVDRRVAMGTKRRFVHSQTWSADGRRILYLGSRRYGRREAIWSVRRDGSNAVRIGVLPRLADRIDWSPDRTRAVFNLAHRLFVLRLDGSGVRPLGPRRRWQIAVPAWCRDGQTVVYASRQDGDWDLRAITTDGRSLGKLTDNLGDDYEPDC